MEPRYMNENRYTYVLGARPEAVSTTVYVAKTPENVFQRYLAGMILEGQTHLQHEEYVLALRKLREAAAWVLKFMHPEMPADPSATEWLPLPMVETLLAPLTAKTWDILANTPITAYTFPQVFMSEKSILPPDVAESLRPATDSGLRVTSFHGVVTEDINRGREAAASRNWHEAVTRYESALASTPPEQITIRAGLLHDLAVVTERAGDSAKAQQHARLSADLFRQEKNIEGQARALATEAGIFTRGGNTRKAAEALEQLSAIKAKNILGDIMLDAGEALTFDPSVPELIAEKFVRAGRPAKSYVVHGKSERATIDVNTAQSGAGITSFLGVLAATQDPTLLMAWVNPEQMVPYIPHMYFFVLPMSIGDCHAGLGNYEEARKSYASVLPYPFINLTYEIVKVWTRLAGTYLERGDAAYRNAKDNAAAYGEAKAFYQAIVRGDKTIDPASPLYAHAKFSGIESRVTSALAAADVNAIDDNPAILTIVFDALTKLRQIEAGLNYFGFAADYAPPFSFEYLQNVARQLAQHASQVEQRYIQYKSLAENEELRREQIEQQAEVAAETMNLETFGITEADLAATVASESLEYAQTQESNANTDKMNFQLTRNDLFRIGQAEAKASAGGNAEMGTKLKDLAHERMSISQNLEAERLDQAITSAQDYVDVAKAQVAQAKARKDIAEQRFSIAKLEHDHAVDNRDFLDMREFSATLWYEIAKLAKRLKQRYLDMATSAAFLMERAYNAETERGLKVIRYDYGSTSAGDLMGGDLLLADIDYFTLDYITNVKTKKVPVKTAVSLAGQHPFQFHLLQTTGRCMFETSFADFDRLYPGLFLAKIRNVEVALVGIGGVHTIAGTLRNTGVSRFRRSDGTIVTRVYPSDVMVLSEYEIRQDALAFRFNPNELRLFENHGIDTLWQLDLPLDANDFDFNEIFDVVITFYYDGFFSRQLETKVRAALPKSGSASRVESLELSAPDELFYLKNKGEAELVFDAAMFPRNQKDLVRTTTTIKVSGKPQTTGGLTLHLTAAGAELVLKTDANGEVRDTTHGAPLKALQGRPVFGEWKIAIRAADNPGLVTSGGALDLSGLDDVLVFFEYTFNYR